MLYLLASVACITRTKHKHRWVSGAASRGKLNESKASADLSRLVCCTPRFEERLECAREMVRRLEAEGLWLAHASTKKLL